jgi:predicted transcriptional regulator
MRRNRKVKMLSDNQKKLLNYINKPFTLKNIAKIIDIADTKSASIVINSLKNKGFLIKSDKKHACIFLTKKALDFLGNCEYTFDFTTLLKDINGTSPMAHES